MATFAGGDAGALLPIGGGLHTTKFYAGGYTVPPGAEPVDANPPVISNISPTPGTELPSRATPITFDVDDSSPGLRLIVITVRYVSLPGTFVVHDGDVFLYPYDSATSERVTTATGYSFAVLPRGDWPADIDELRVYAIDRAGNLEGV